MEKKFIPVPIIHLLKHATLFDAIEIHVKVADKHVRLNFSEEPFQDILNKLLKKSVVHVYLDEEDFSQVLSKFQQSLSSKEFTDSKTSEELKANAAETAVMLARSFIKQYGANAQVLAVIKDGNQKIQDLLTSSPGLFNFIKRFKDNCSEEFLKISVTNFLAAMVIEQFPWKTPLIVEKTMLAGTFCDITLEVHDFDALHEWEERGTELPEHIKKHPLRAIELLAIKRDLIPQETLTIIEQHHERPDGKGFPHGITVTRFNQLASIFIVCQRFTDELFRNEFDYGKHAETVAKLQTIYHGGVFNKSMEALLKVVEA